MTTTQAAVTDHFKLAAATWDTPDRIELLKRYAQKIKAHLGNRNPQKVLEIGCGTGLLGANFISRATEFWGIDTSPEMLAVFLQKFPGHPHVHLEVFNLEENDLNHAGFDLVISSMAFHHLKNPEAVLKRLKPWLNQGAQIAIIDLDKEDGSFHADPENMGVQHFGFSRDTLASWAQTAGFRGFSHELIHTIEKDSGTYPIFLAVYE